LGKASGLDLLQHSERKNYLTDTILGDGDLKKIKLLKMRQAAVLLFGCYHHLIERDGWNEREKRCSGNSERKDSRIKG